MTYSELLQQLTVESQDNGEVFTRTNRLERIKSLLHESSYELLYAGKLALIYGKKEVTPAKARLLVSSHIDTVYTHCFCEETDTHWKGTFDNSATNTALLQLMLENKIGDHVLIAFTGDEEIESRGAQEVKRWCSQQTWYPSAILVLDVTNEGWDDSVSFSIENDRGFDLLTAHQIISSIQESEQPCVFLHDALPDETWIYGEKQYPDDRSYPCLSLCLPVGGDMHSDTGCWLRKREVPIYQSILCRLLDETCR